MKVAVPGASWLNHALKALPGVRSESAGSTTKVRIAAAAESFRLLALNLRILLPADSTPAVVVMSAFPHEGRSFVAENLAVAMAEQDPVMLVEKVHGVGRQHQERRMRDVGNVEQAERDRQSKADRRIEAAEQHPDHHRIEQQFK